MKTDKTTITFKFVDGQKITVKSIHKYKEFAEAYIESAINIDFYSETFRDEIDSLDKNKSYLVYCRSGRRSRSALDIMAEPNFREAYNVLGGIIQWQAEGLPTIK